VKAANITEVLHYLLRATVYSSINSTHRRTGQHTAQRAGRRHISQHPLVNYKYAGSCQRFYSFIINYGHGLGNRVRLPPTVIRTIVE
jgi:hypothetical protein